MKTNAELDLLRQAMREISDRTRNPLSDIELKYLSVFMMLVMELNRTQRNYVLDGLLAISQNIRKIVNKGVNTLTKIKKSKIVN